MWRSWVFDLDNTLYPASSNLFPQIDLRMRQFIAQALHLSLEDAFVLQKNDISATMAPRCAD